MGAWIRDRRLAGDGRAGSWARAKATRSQLTFVRDTWRRLVGLLIAAGALTVGVAYLIPAGFWRGLIVDILATTVVAMLFVVVLEVTGTAAVQMGSIAEQWSASELRPLRKQGWRLINHFLLTGFGDIDHLLVGPAGVIVAETKWRSSGWTVHPPDQNVQKAIEQVTRAARASCVAGTRSGKPRVRYGPSSSFGAAPTTSRQRIGAITPWWER